MDVSSNQALYYFQQFRLACTYEASQNGNAKQVEERVNYSRLRITEKVIASVMLAEKRLRAETQELLE